MTDNQIVIFYAFYTVVFVNYLIIRSQEKIVLNFLSKKSKLTEVLLLWSFILKLFKNGFLMLYPSVLCIRATL
jgi:hypothetical protein